MDLTVCVCSRDRPTYLRQCLAGLRRQTVSSDQFELLLIDSRSGPAAAAELEKCAVEFGARLVRADEPGVSAARSLGARLARGTYIAFVDDDAVPADDWVATILAILRQGGSPPTLIGGRILPRWEAPLPAWWPPSLRGVLSIIEHEGQGEYRGRDLPRTVEPYAANMVVHVPSLLAVGGFGADCGRFGETLLSDEDVQLAWALQDAGHAIRYDPRLVVYHQIQAGRLRPEWLLSRLYYWQGACRQGGRPVVGSPVGLGCEHDRNQGTGHDR